VPQDSRAPDNGQRAYCDRVASASDGVGGVFRAALRMTRIFLAPHRGRALQLTNILRDIDEDAGPRPAFICHRGAVMLDS